MVDIDGVGASDLSCLEGPNWVLDCLDWGCHVDQSSIGSWHLDGLAPPVQWTIALQLFRFCCAWY